MFINTNIKNLNNIKLTFMYVYNLHIVTESNLDYIIYVCCSIQFIKCSVFKNFCNSLSGSYTIHTRQ